MFQVISSVNAFTSYPALLQSFSTVETAEKVSSYKSAWIGENKSIRVRVTALVEEQEVERELMES